MCPFHYITLFSVHQIWEGGTSDKFNLAFVIFINEIPKKADGSTDYDLKNEIQTTISDLGLELVELYKVNEF